MLDCGSIWWHICKHGCPVREVTLRFGFNCGIWFSLPCIAILLMLLVSSDFMKEFFVVPFTCKVLSQAWCFAHMHTFDFHIVHAIFVLDVVTWTLHLCIIFLVVTDCLCACASYLRRFHGVYYPLRIIVNPLFLRLTFCYCFPYGFICDAGSLLPTFLWFFFIDKIYFLYGLLLIH